MAFDLDDLYRLLDPGYLKDLDSMPLDELRSKRGELQGVEVRLSYVRRLAQGRLDIVHAELERRAGKQSEDLAEMVAHLAEILADKAHPAGPGRLPLVMAPDLEDEDLTGPLDGIAGVAVLGDLASLERQEVDRIAQALGEFEGTLSARRRAVHERIDALQEELVGRYRSGEANVDNLLP